MMPYSDHLIADEKGGTLLAGFRGDSAIFNQINSYKP